MAVFSKQFKVSVPDSILYQMQDAAQRQIKNRIQRASKLIESSVKKLIIDAVKDSTTFKSIKGDFKDFYGGDLQAEFGLTQGMADRALEKLVEILGGTIHVEIETERTSRTWKINFIVQRLNPEEYETKLKSGVEFWYENKNPPEGQAGKVEALITWMQWLLEEASSIIDEYGITYIGSGQSGGLTYREVLRSRSGRALMTKKESISARFPYSLPKEYIPSGGKNFIDDIRNNLDLKRKITEIVENIIEKEVLKN